MKKVCKEELNKYIIEVTDIAKERFDLTETEDDELFDALEVVLDKFFKYPDYLHYL